MINTLIKWSILQYEVITVNVYVPSIGASKTIKQILTDLNGEIQNQYAKTVQHLQVN